MSTDDLRRAAEERAGQVGPGGPAVPGDDVADADRLIDRDALIHELRVHQIELELQNEELRRTQGVLEEARAEYAELYDDAPVGYLSLTEGAVIARCNRTFAAMLGCEPDRLTGRRLADWIAPVARDAFLRRFGALFRDPTGKSVDVLCRSEDGTERILQLGARRAHGRAQIRVRAGQARHTLLVAATDVTERRKSEANVRELLEQKELLLRELRHRTSNNYQVVLAVLALEADAADDERVTGALRRVESRIRSMVVVQESLADAQHGIRTDVGAYLELLLGRIFAALDPDGRVTVSTRTATGEVDARVASALGLIVNELVANAWKHALSGRDNGRLDVLLERTDDAWVVSITDNGRDPSVIRNPASTSGLGQALVNSLTDQLGGTFERRTTDEGTRCTVRLPARLFDAPRATMPR